MPAAAGFTVVHKHLLLLTAVCKQLKAHLQEQLAQMPGSLQQGAGSEVSRNGHPQQQIEDTFCT